MFWNIFIKLCRTYKKVRNNFGKILGEILAKFWNIFRSIPYKLWELRWNSWQILNNFQKLMEKTSKTVCMLNSNNIIFLMKSCIHTEWNPPKAGYTLIAKYTRTITNCEKQKMYSGIFRVTFFAFCTPFLLFSFRARVNMRTKNQKILWFIFSGH